MSEKTPINTNKRFQQTQAQVNEVVDIMRANVDKVLERDKNLSQLDGRAGIFIIFIMINVINLMVLM